MKKKVTWPGGWLIVRSGAVTDELNAQIISAEIMNSYNNANLQGFWGHFGVLCSQTVASEGLPFKPESVSKLGVLDKQAAYEAYLRVPIAIRRKWTAAVNDTNGDDSVKTEDVDEETPKP